MYAAVLTILFALSSSEDAREILDKAIDVQQGARPREEIRDLFFSCDLHINEGDSTTNIGMDQYYKNAGKRSRDDKIVTLVEDDLNAKKKGELQEGYNGSDFWVKNGDEVTILGKDPVWDQSKKDIRGRLRMIQTFRRIFFLANLSQEIRPIRRLDGEKDELRIEARPNEPTAWGVEKLELTFDAKTYLLEKATIYPLEARENDGLVLETDPPATSPAQRLVDDVTHIDFLNYDRRLSESGLAVPEKVLVRQNSSNRWIRLEIFKFEFNQDYPDSRFDPPR
ncbi:MAG: hypothetical protein RL885_24770 [Planctomycetota bacterium]